MSSKRSINHQVIVVVEKMHKEFNTLDFVTKGGNNRKRQIIKSHREVRARSNKL